MNSVKQKLYYIMDLADQINRQLFYREPQSKNFTKQKVPIFWSDITSRSLGYNFQPRTLVHVFHLQYDSVNIFSCVPKGACLYFERKILQLTQLVHLLAALLAVFI